MKRLYLTFGLFCMVSISLFAQEGAFDLLYQQHQAHNLAFKMQDLLKVKFGDFLIQQGYDEDGTGGYRKSLTENGNIILICRVADNHIETTIQFIATNASEQREMFD